MPLNFLDAKSSIFSGVNPFEVSEFVRRNVGTHSLRLAHSSSASASLKHRKAGSVDLCRLSYGTEARVISEGLADIYHAQFILRGVCRYTLPDATLDLSAGHFLLINPHEPLDLTYSPDCEKFIVKIPSSMVHEACAEHRWFAAKECIKFNQVPYRFLISNDVQPGTPTGLYCTQIQLSCWEVCHADEPNPVSIRTVHARVSPALRNRAVLRGGFGAGTLACGVSVSAL